MGVIRRLSYERGHKLETQVVETKEEVIKKEKLWNLNFLLLWQGQLVSALGDVVYEIALGFWVLQKTGSTALMGALMASAAIPRLIISPFAGVWVDRLNRRNILVVTDAIRGLLVVLIGIAAITGHAEVWMVFAVAVISGACAAFFNPAVESALPDLVDNSKLMKANSVFSMLYSGSSIVGNPIGGFIYQTFGAPLMFLFNGISYLFSAATEVFIKIPKIVRPSEELHFMDDMKEGYTFIWRFRGLRDLILTGALLNLFTNMGMVLFLPLFQKTPELGPAKYGIVMGALTAGMLIGMFITTVVDIPNKKKLSILLTSCFVFTGFMAIFPLTNSIMLMMALLLVGGIANSLLNTIIAVSFQLCVPQNMRGKVFALMQTVNRGLSPIGLALGGILAEFLNIRYVISGAFFATFIVFIFFSMMKNPKALISFDPEKQALEDIM
ncbi:MAG: bacE [Clostridia bacterium]|nr:bacE [Clostridia bacterium]